jgi:hypothetical protein
MAKGRKWLRVRMGIAGGNSHAAAGSVRSVAAHDGSLHVTAANSRVAGFAAHCGVRLRGWIPWQGSNICQSAMKTEPSAGRCLLACRAERLVGYGPALA